MLYGYPVSTGPGPDETINFGASAFHYDPRAILAAAGIDTSRVAGWVGEERSLNLHGSEPNDALGCRA